MSEMGACMSTLYVRPTCLLPHLFREMNRGMGLTPFRHKMGKRKPSNLAIRGFGGGRNRTRTCDPIDVNDVLYQLSHATS